jgi:hypothetical protein
MEERDFLVRIRDKIDIVISKVAVKEPLIEVSSMISGRLKDIEKNAVLAKE